MKHATGSTDKALGGQASPSVQPLTADVASGGASAIIDNQQGGRVGDFLKQHILPGSDLSFVSAFFTIYAYEALRDELEGAAHLRFLYGNPEGTESPDPKPDQKKSFDITTDKGMKLSQTLTQKILAQECARWIEEKVDIRAIDRAEFLHGKLYHIASEQGDAALLGSSNFTKRGLGFGASPNIELNLDVHNDEDRAALLDWFNNLWNDKVLTHDAKGEVLAALGRLGKTYSPEFVYYKTLFHVFEDWLQNHDERGGLLGEGHFYDSIIWNSLYKFQQDGVVSAINRLMKYNGCIIADSVGLGKTWTALAVIKFFESRNDKVLVLCPKRLEENWLRYTAYTGSIHNKFEKDRLNYLVRAHTDLRMYEGNYRDIRAENFNWGAFDLIVIDESHNFRNEGRDKYDDKGNFIKHSSYNRLLEEALRDGGKTKVLMLSATPVNTSLRDLRNQTYLMTEKQQDAFREALNIGDIENLFGIAQREFQQWEKEQAALRQKPGYKMDKVALLENLGSDFLVLLDEVSFARSREHLKRYYKDEMDAVGGFPQRTKPENLHPPTDSQGKLSYDNLHDRIGEFRLAIYEPSAYVLDESILELDLDIDPFGQRQREKSLIGMMRINMLKRLESSVHSFTLTLSRTLEKIDTQLEQITEWRASRDMELAFEPEPDEDLEDDEFVVGKGRQYHLKELNVDLWEQDLIADRKLIARLHQDGKAITVDRDAKLAALKKVLRRKVEHPTSSRDGRTNRKALVFTTFSDTARYLYDNMEEWATKELDVQVAMVTGGDGNHSTVGTTRFDDVLAHFAPIAQERDLGGEKEIDILIATDCLSEGQNLQDCDLVINYDIHWNPVRLLQRFGRIDRLGSKSKEVGMINFWPTQDLNHYLNLKHRVEARMALADATATGLDDPLNDEEKREIIQGELNFRDRQLARMHDEILDLDKEEGIGLNDLTLDDFIADLLQYIQKNRQELKSAPCGIYAITRNQTDSIKNVEPGVIFCLKRADENAPERLPTRLWPYFLIYVTDNGKVRYSFQQAKQCLGLFQALASGESSIANDLENAFDKETNQGENMSKYDKLLSAALQAIESGLRGVEFKALTEDKYALLDKKPEQKGADEGVFELITWFIIKDAQAGAKS